MKIAIGACLVNGPYGGGNAALGSLATYLSDSGLSVTFDLAECDLDFILLTEPRSSLRISAFNHKDIARYLLVNPETMVVHRVNECDERKGTDGVNAKIIEANYFADHTVFVSSWLKTLYSDLGIDTRNVSVIKNGSNNEIFSPKDYLAWQGQGPLKLVTHHWGANWEKGFDIYKMLDDMLDEKWFREKYAFSYVGNLPEGFSFRNVSVLPPCSGEELVSAIQRHHVYLTGSENEPGSNHQNEGALLGLPLLYLDSASMSEYCEGFGIGFTKSSFSEKLDEMHMRYSAFVPTMHSFPWTADKMGDSFKSLFEEMLTKKSTYLSDRKLWKRPLLVARALAGLV